MVASNRIAATAARMKIPIMRPLLPTTETLLPYLKQIDDNRYYSNFGPLEQEFRYRLSSFLGSNTNSLCTTSSATSALHIALSAMTRVASTTGRTKCLVPSWTFAATPLAAINAGLSPHFVDIDPATWMLAPDQMVSRNDLGEVAAIIVTAPFGQPPDVAAWNQVAATTGIPVIIDAAASFDSIVQHGLSAVAKIPIVLSFHATKAFGIGEGGMILSSDASFVAQCRDLSNFGFKDERIAHEIGANAKLSEYSSAVGLAALDGWLIKRQKFANARNHYQTKLANNNAISLMPGTSKNWIASTFNIMFAGDLDKLLRNFKDKGIETRQWWSLGCHKQPAFADVSQDPLAQTDRLASQVIGLPLSPDITYRDIDYVCETLSSCR